MKRGAVSGLILMLLSTSILTLTFNSQSAKADGEYILSAWADTTPVMDGVLALSEWDDAASVSFTLVWESESHSVTLYEKNDAQYLYLAATVLDDDFDSRDMAAFYFDNAHDGGRDDGDDWIYVVAWTTGQGLAVDGYFNASENCWHSDTTHGGTNDILGGSSHTNVGGMGDYTFELRHPLNSEDDAHDISLELGDTVGVRMAYNDAFPGGHRGSTWPSLLEFADIIIAHECMPKGIDVSHYQGDINWAQVYGEGYRFAFAKATEGDHRPPVIIDPYFTVNMNEGVHAGLLMGAYHLAHPEMNDAVDEAQFFVSIAGPYLREGYLRPFLDLEQEIVNEVIGEKGEDEGRKYLSNWVVTWISTVEEETGVESIIYVGSYTAKNYLNDAIARYNLWIANYNYDPPDIPSGELGIWDSWDFWQYSDQGYVPSISVDVDLDLFNGNIQRLQEAFVIPAPPPRTIGELKSETEESGFEGQIDNKGTVNSLLAKLNAAQKLVDEGKIDQAKNILDAFIKEVRAQSGKHITQETAELLMEAAEYIISNL